MLAVSAIAIGLLAIGGSSRLTANTSVLPPGALAPSARERMIARQVGSLLEDAHYSRLKIDDSISPRVMDKFLNGMDGQRSYFLASDIAEFEAYRLRFDDMIRTGDIEPAYAMFARYQQRNRERVQYALSLLDTEPDFTLDEQFEFDREGAAWPASKAELDELWRKRVKNDAISLLLAGKNWTEIRDTLRTRYDRVLKRAEQIKPEEVFELFLNSYARTFDPHSSYFSPRNSEEYKIQMSLNYEGIGASLQTVDDYVTIMNLIEGGPAAAAGTLSVNDRITAVGQGKEGPLTDVIGWRIDDVVQLIRGKGGTVVRLQVLPVGAAPGSPEKLVEFTRGKVTLEAQAARKELKIIKRGDREHRIGVINVPGFYSDYDAQRAGDATMLDVVGDGPEREALMAHAASLGLAERVRWYGALAQPALVPLYQGARALAIPSREEGLGLVAVEAQLCGTPVVAYADGGLIDVVRPEHGGTLVAVGDTRALGEALARLLADEASAHERGMAARDDMLARFSPAAVAGQYLSLYRQAVQ